jgi:hypothetical protein
MMGVMAGSVVMLYFGGAGSLTGRAVDVVSIRTAAVQYCLSTSVLLGGTYMYSYTNVFANFSVRCMPCVYCPGGGKYWRMS